MFDVSQVPPTSSGLRAWSSVHNVSWGWPWSPGQEENPFPMQERQQVVPHDHTPLGQGDRVHLCTGGQGHLLTSSTNPPRPIETPSTPTMRNEARSLGSGNCIYMEPPRHPQKPASDRPTVHRGVDTGEHRASQEQTRTLEQRRKTYEVRSATIRLGTPRGQAPSPSPSPRGAPRAADLSLLTRTHPSERQR